MSPLALAERIIALFAQASFSATYKHALLLALLDLCFEKTSRTGVPPTSVTTRELAEQVLALYWPQCVPWEQDQYLRQGGGAREQAEIVAGIIKFRISLGRSDSAPISSVRRDRPEHFERLVRFVEWKLIEMPIPRLQVLGRREDRFLYEYGWDMQIAKAEVSAYQRGAGSEFDNSLKLFPGVAEALIVVNGLLRPMIRREWLRLIQRMNNEPEALLECFLFDRERQALAAVRGPLAELQVERCFFCAGRLSDRSDVDHFIPWARFPNNALENLVVTHQRCNNAKSDFLASAEHVKRWAGQVSACAIDLAKIATDTGFASEPERTYGIAAATYLRLPEGALLWRKGRDFEELNRGTLMNALQVF